MGVQRAMQTECWHCRHRRAIPRSYHIACVKGDARMTGRRHGIKHGWFDYPDNFDPTWKTRFCANFEPEDGKETP